METIKIVELKPSDKLILVFKEDDITAAQLAAFRDSLKNFIGESRIAVVVGDFTIVKVEATNDQAK